MSNISTEPFGQFVDNIRQKPILSDELISLHQQITEHLQDYSFDQFSIIRGRISTLVRCHLFESLPKLKECVLSLALQTYPAVEAIILLQNFNATQVNQVRQELDSVWNRDPALLKLVPVEVIEGKDGRSKLLNIGFKLANSQYLAILDYDDIVYEHAYEILIDRLTKGQAALAAGACVAKIYNTQGVLKPMEPNERPYAWGRRQIDLFKDNFMPTHSFVLDRTRIPKSILKFDESLEVMEDYEFLLRLACLVIFDFACIDRPVCEYRFDQRGYNTNWVGSAPNNELEMLWNRNHKIVNAQKRKLKVALSVECIGELIANIEQLRNELAVSKNELTISRAENIILTNQLSRKLHRWVSRMHRQLDKSPFLRKIIRTPARAVTQSANFYRLFIWRN